VHCGQGPRFQSGARAQRKCKSWGRPGYRTLTWERVANSIFLTGLQPPPSTRPLEPELATGAAHREHSGVARPSALRADLRRAQGGAHSAPGTGGMAPARPLRAASRDHKPPTTGPTWRPVNFTSWAARGGLGAGRGRRRREGARAGLPPAAERGSGAVQSGFAREK
jgi:hypothetical protein